MANLVKQKNKAIFKDLGNRLFFVENVIDYAVEPPTAADTYALWDVPVGAVVLNQSTEILVDASGALTVEVGDEDTAALFDTGIDLNTTAGTWYSTTKGTDAGALGNAYPVKKEIRATFNNTVTTGKAYFCMTYAVSDFASDLVA